MIKKIFFMLMFWMISFGTAIAQKAPWIVNLWLPDGGAQETGVATEPTNLPFETLANNFISTFIQFVAVVAVLALILSGIQLILSWGEEEKMKKARKWFIWSLTWVIVSLLAFFIITFINNLNIGW